MKTIITNTSPIIALSMVGKLSFLWELFDKVYVFPKPSSENLRQVWLKMIMEERRSCQL